MPWSEIISAVGGGVFVSAFMQFSQNRVNKATDERACATRRADDVRARELAAAEALFGAARTQRTSFARPT